MSGGELAGANRHGRHRAPGRRHRQRHRVTRDPSLPLSHSLVTAGASPAAPLLRDLRLVFKSTVGVQKHCLGLCNSCC
jgi:hypothetical protein